MRPTLPALLATAALGLGAVATAGCGSSQKLIPVNAATTMDDQLQRAADATSAGDCQTALAALAAAQKTFIRLPVTVDLRLRRRIQSGLAGLAQTLPVDCAAAALPAAPTTPTTGTTGTTGTTTTDTTTTDTTPTTTTTTPTTTAPPVGGVSPEGGTTTGTTP